MKPTVLGLIFLALAPFSAKGQSLTEAAKWFPTDVQDRRTIADAEASGSYAVAERALHGFLAAHYPAPYAKGLADKCKAFSSPALCEAVTIRRMLAEQRDHSMDEIYNSVR